MHSTMHEINANLKGNAHIAIANISTNAYTITNACTNANHISLKLIVLGSMYTYTYIYT